MTEKMQTPNPWALATVGTYIPRRCGIGTFTSDLCESLAAKIEPQGVVEAIVMDDMPEGYDYPERVKFQVRAHLQSDYFRAAEFANVRQYSAVLLQHEYGIYGGPDGVYVLGLVKALRMPVLTTLHSVLLEPSAGQRRILLELAYYSDLLVVMSEKARAILKDAYHVPDSRIAVIPHGIPDIPFGPPDAVKAQFGVDGRKVILTFGLLGPGKGIEVMLDAMPEIIREHPDAVYLIVGATHPHIQRVAGDQYRHNLQIRIDRLGIADHVIFHNHFVSLELLCRYLRAADVYATPYPSMSQIVSGTLAYAMGAGCAAVSTPYWYAEEMLSDGRGQLAPFGDSRAFAREICALLADDKARERMRWAAYEHCRPMVWPEVARSYLDRIGETQERRATEPRPFSHRPPRTLEELPEPNLRHLRTMTDGTGLLQHAIFTTPNRQHGYCTDDNARALVFASRYAHMTEDESILPLLHTYLAFVNDAYNPENGRFRNFMSYDRRWLEETGSEDSHGRALWALGEAARLAPDLSVRDMACQLFNASIGIVESLDSPRAWAGSIIGLQAYLEVYGGDAVARRRRGTLAQRLHDMFLKNADEEWFWCEDAATYDNGRLPQALLLAGQWIPDSRMFETGLRALAWLLKAQTAPDGHISPIGHQGWGRRDSARSKFDQQPLELAALIEACAEAYRATGDPRWRGEAQRCLRWFLGQNDVNTPLYDYKTGGCHDGLGPNGVNANQGAESTLAWLISLLTMHQIAGVEVLVAGKAEGAPAMA
ncbi:MAG: glycosyltransferase family 4 protein [Candidatus Sumerlaeota bacterium]|nr:glycosyltransferase family 4 protein [Candidatus Sumerlaeota bacterium]